MKVFKMSDSDGALSGIGVPESDSAICPDLGAIEIIDDLNPMRSRFCKFVLE